ncbi:hypothetical protein [Streptomyces sp. NPDC058718]|uniref:hypothetical protein n=1 Tax=Streptomyces sp. NPDC058718 TaxID=3346610 RepID=UPI00367853FD
MTPSESTQVAVELAEMRGEIRTGFAEVSGRLDLTLQRTDQNERAQAEQRDTMKRVEERVDALEAKAEASATHGPRLAAVEKLAWTAVGIGLLAVPAGGWLVNVLVK